MRKKLQIFISSTYTDLIEERQAAVQAVLAAGHIPAGMELFTAGDESQQEVIKEWIEESDAYMLILGGRYGSLLPSGEKSYTHWEYDYAEDIGKPRFALVLSDAAIDAKIKVHGKKILEEANAHMYRDFKENLCKSKLVSFIDDLKDIENRIFKSLMKIEQKYELAGWISGKDVPNSTEILQMNFDLHVENEKLKSELKELEGKINSNVELTYSGYTYEQVCAALQGRIITIPTTTDKENLLDLLPVIKNIYATGLSINKKDEQNQYIYQDIIPSYMTYGLMEIVDNRLYISSLGFKFIARHEQENLKRKRRKS